MKKIILTISTAIICVLATAQLVNESIPTYIFTGSSSNSPYRLEIQFYDQFAEQVTIEKDGYSFDNSLPFQIATINLLSYLDEHWVVAEHLFHYEYQRKQKNGGQISLKYRKTPDDNGGWKSWVEPEISIINPRDYERSWLLLKKINISGDFINPFDANTPNLQEEITCFFELKTTGEPSKNLFTENFTGVLMKLDGNGNPKNEDLIIQNELIDWTGEYVDKFNNILTIVGPNKSGEVKFQFSDITSLTCQEVSKSGIALLSRIYVANYQEEGSKCHLNFSLNADDIEVSEYDCDHGASCGDNNGIYTKRK